MMKTGNVQIVVDKLIETELITKNTTPLTGIYYLLQKSTMYCLKGCESTRIPTVESIVSQSETDIIANGFASNISSTAYPMELMLSASLSKILLIITIPTSMLARITDTPNPVIAE